MNIFPLSQQVTLRNKESIVVVWMPATFESLGSPQAKVILDTIQRDRGILCVWYNIKGEGVDNPIPPQLTKLCAIDTIVPTQHIREVCLYVDGSVGIWAHERPDDFNDDGWFVLVRPRAS